MMGMRGIREGGKKGARYVIIKYAQWGVGDL
jgi:hypothetical protein